MRCHQFLWVTLGVLVITHTAHGITEVEKARIKEGIEKGKSFTASLQSTGFTKVLKGFTETIVPWVDAIGLFGDFLGIFEPEDTSLVDEMKRGFNEVNKRLDAIKDKITEVKEAIDWAVVKVNFQGIEEDIRIMDEKLKEVLRAPNPDHGMKEFIRVYEAAYHEAGLKLYDAIVHNDQVFSENILTAGMKYINYYRSKHQNFMRGLISLLMKASTIEISYERFKKHERGMTSIWKLRLQECKESMEKADKALEAKWASLFREETNKVAEGCNGCSNEALKNRMYNFLTAKYYWRNWFVLVYDPVLGGDKHAIYYTPSNTHFRFRYHGHNWIVGTSDASNHFDRNLAQSYIKNRSCSKSVYDCRKDAGFILLQQCPFHGVLTATVSSIHSGWSVIGLTSRLVQGSPRLTHGSYSWPFTMWYFG